MLTERTVIQETHRQGTSAQESRQERTISQNVPSLQSQNESQALNEKNSLPLEEAKRKLEFVVLNANPATTAKSARNLVLAYKEDIKDLLRSGNGQKNLNRLQKERKYKRYITEAVKRGKAKTLGKVGVTPGELFKNGIFPGTITEEAIDPVTGEVMEPPSLGYKFDRENGFALVTLNDDFSLRIPGKTPEECARNFSQILENS